MELPHYPQKAELVVEAVAVVGISSSARWLHFLLPTKIASFYVSHIWYEGVTLASHGRRKSQNTRYANDVAEFVYLHIDQ